jgi:hypothetical protein
MRCRVDASTLLALDEMTVDGAMTLAELCALLASNPQLTQALGVGAVVAASHVRVSALSARWQPARIFREHNKPLSALGLAYVRCLCSALPCSARPGRLL